MLQPRKVEPEIYLGVVGDCLKSFAECISTLQNSSLQSDQAQANTLRDLALKNISDNFDKIVKDVINL